MAITFAHLRNAVQLELIQEPMTSVKVICFITILIQFICYPVIFYYASMNLYVSDPRIICLCDPKVIY